MFNFDKIYVINLESRFDRKHAFNTRYRHKLNYEYINAVPGESINVPDLIKQGKLNKSFYDPNGMVNKNIIASHLPLPDKASVEKILFASRKLEFTWLLILFAFCFF